MCIGFLPAGLHCTAGGVHFALNSCLVSGGASLAMAASSNAMAGSMAMLATCSPGRCWVFKAEVQHLQGMRGIALATSSAG
jgi:hypothetical protein